MLRQAVGLAVFVDLQEMLDPPEEDIIVREPSAISRGQDARFGQGREAREAVGPQEPGMRNARG